MTHWHNLRSLSWFERALLAGALILLPLSDLSLRLLGFRRTQAVFAWLLPVRSLGQLPVNARQTTLLVQAASRRAFPRATCLHRSLTLWSLLRVQGVDTRLLLGARKSLNQFEAHAWIEYEGLVLNDTGDVRQRFAAFVEENAA
jgi:transglutaminase superfamily protein